MNVQGFDLRAYLNATNTPFWEAGKNVSRGWLGMQCLYCNDHHNHMGVHLVRKNISCWLCGAKGSLTDLITDLENISYRAAVDRIEEYQGFAHLEPEERERLEDIGQSVLPDDCRPLTSTHREYLEDVRGFDADRLVRDWGLCSGPVVGAWKHRIIIPVVVEGRTMTFVGMDHTGKRDAKYLAAPVEESFIPTSELVYGADYAGRNAVVVEGTTDAWRIGRGALATFGMTPGNRRIVHLLSLRVEHFYVLYDGEMEADKHARNLVAVLRKGNKKADALELSRGDDPDMFTAQEVADLRYDLKLDT